MTSELRVEYSRQGTTYTGTIMSVDEDEVAAAISFSGSPFRDIVSELHKMLKVYRAPVKMIRTDQTAMAPVYLEEALVELIVTDPVEAIRLMSPPPVVVDMRTASKRQQVRDTARMKVATAPQAVKTLAIRACHDTLADAFGDDVYFRRRGDKVECPFCGRWEKLKQYEGKQFWFDHKGPSKAGYSVQGATVSVETEDMTENWMRFPTKQLLHCGENILKGQDRYYLPREWNKPGPWISHGDLQKRYEEYLKEKESCLETAAR